MLNRNAEQYYADYVKVRNILLVEQEEAVELQFQAP